MGRLGILALKGLGVLLLAFVALSVVVTAVGLLLWLVGAAISALVTLAILALFVLAGIGLYTVLREGTASGGKPTQYEGRSRERTASERDRKSEVEERYVDGELTDAEFERELERVLSDDDEFAGRPPEEPVARSIDDLDVDLEHDRDPDR